MIILGRLTDEKLHAALSRLEKESLPARVAFKLKGIVKTVREEYAKFDEVRQNAFIKYGEKNDDELIW
jgi:hypothetical protein